MLTLVPTASTMTGPSAVSPCAMGSGETACGWTASTAGEMVAVVWVTGTTGRFLGLPMGFWAE